MQRMMVMMMNDDNRPPKIAAIMAYIIGDFLCCVHGVVFASGFSSAW